MPRSASRISLEITAVRVERVQDISEEDAKAEGCQKVTVLNETNYYPGHEYSHTSSVIDEFKRIWDSINEKRGFGWAKNPWVWVIEFGKI